MREAWAILAVLAVARTTMGLQFQSVAALGPQIIAATGMSYGAFGLLVGLYLLPGVALAIPGGWLGARFGEKRLVLVGLALMAAGGAGLLAGGLGPMLAARAVSGAGAVLLNVLVTKMVADWFQPPRTVAAMGVLVTSWPLGIALAMVALPPFGVTAGLAVAAGLPALALLAVAAIYRTPEGFARAPGRPPALHRAEVARAAAAGGAWTFYNAAFILVVAFGPALLISRGAGEEAASAAVSLVGWLIIPGLVGGGWLAARTGRPDAVMLGGFALCAGLIAVLAAPLPAVWALAAMGLAFGPPGPVIMGLPVATVAEDKRALALGVYFTTYYAGMALAPPAAGALRDLTGLPAAPMALAVACLGVAAASVLGLRRLEARAAQS